MVPVCGSVQGWLLAPAGIVVANDADAQRCNLLAHQTKRMCSPALIVTNHDATMYPIVTDHTTKVGFVLAVRILFTTFL